ncbi:hypothetical protein [Streptomyces sp. bgisy091]|uniref:hypothetical protein n=1 Tax=Streptomyces sp. bgisy091 TaxID=3413778 RepID=UPI003D74092F
MQDDNPRRTLDELATLYELEPEIKDIYVEGRSDKNFLEVHILPGATSLLCNIFAVSDRVHIPDGELIKSGLMVGNRSRIIWLAQQLADRIPGHASAVLVADKDFSSLGADKAQETHGLLYTDYSSMEAYALNELTISKLLRISVGAPPYVTASSLISAIKATLISLFVIRLCLRDSGTGATIPPKVLTRWDLDDHSHVKVIDIFRSALSAIRADERGDATPESLYEHYTEYIEQTKDEFKNFINGHDVSLAIVRYLKSECSHVFNSDNRRPLQAPPVMEVVLMSCVETSHLDGEKLFEKLRRWIANMPHSSASAT